MLVYVILANVICRTPLKGLRNLPSFILDTIFCVGFGVKFVMSQGQTNFGQILVNSGQEIIVQLISSFGQPSE